MLSTSPSSPRWNASRRCAPGRPELIRRAATSLFAEAGLQRVERMQLLSKPESQGLTDAEND